MSPAELNAIAFGFCTVPESTVDITPVLRSIFRMAF